MFDVISIIPNDIEYSQYWSCTGPLTSCAHSIMTADSYQRQITSFNT